MTLKLTKDTFATGTAKKKRRTCSCCYCCCRRYLDVIHPAFRGFGNSSPSFTVFYKTGHPYKPRPPPETGARPNPGTAIVGMRSRKSLLLLNVPRRGNVVSRNRISLLLGPPSPLPPRIPGSPLLAERAPSRPLVLPRLPLLLLGPPRLPLLVLGPPLLLLAPPPLPR